MNSTLAHLSDQTALKPDTTIDAIIKLAEETQRYGFASVCGHCD